MRTRTRSQPPLPQANSYLARRNGSVWAEGVFNYTPISLTEKIVDEGTPFRNYRSKYCQHTKHELEVSPNTSPFYSWTSSWGACQVQYTLPINQSRVPTGSPITVPPLSVNDVNALFIEMRQHIPPTLSLANFLLELDDIPSLVKRLRKGIAPYGRVRDFNQLRKQLGRDWLTYNFGLRPLVDDIRKSLQTLDSVRKRIRYLKKTYGQPVTVRRKKTFEHQPPAYSDPTTVVQNVYPYWFQRVFQNDITRQWTRISSTHVVGATMVQSLGGLEYLEARMSGLLAAFGFNKPLSIVWEAIPFSWLVDYLFNVQQFLDQYSSSQPFTGEITLRDGWSSMKVESEYRLRSHWKESVYSSAVRSMTVGTGKITTYTRDVGIPTGNGVLLRPQDGPMSLSQYLNIVAILQ